MEIKNPFKLIDFLYEGIQNIRGETKWLETNLQTPHIQKIINELAMYLKVPVSQIEQDIKEKFDSYPKPQSKIAEETMYKNALESVIFNELRELTKNDTKDNKFINKSPRFSIRIFQDLWNMIRAEHDDLFPLTSIINKKAIMPKYIILPSASNPEWNEVDTAAIDANATIGFNTKFMQDLLDFAHLKGLQPQGKKYTNNGGSIPAEYAYIEFLILHEFMHYIYADQYYQQKLKAHPVLINLTGDFRTNQVLVKAGYEQIPVGMFSEHINYDKQKTYKEMYDLVKKEFSKDQDNKTPPPPPPPKPPKDVFEVGDIVTTDNGKTKHRVVKVGQKDANGDYDLELEEIINESWRVSHRHLFEATITVKAKADGVKLVSQSEKSSQSGSQSSQNSTTLPTWSEDNGNGDGDDNNDNNDNSDNSDNSDDGDNKNQSDSGEPQSGRSDKKDKNKENKSDKGDWEASNIEIPEHLKPHDSHETPGAQWDFDSEDVEHGDFDEMNKRSDEKAKEIQQALKKAQENQVSTAKEALEKIRRKEQEQADKQMDRVATDLQIIKAKINWIKLLDKLINNVFGQIQDTSYQKVSKRSISSITQAAQGMPGVIKPGDILSPEGEQKKLIIVIDSSGSMQDKIGQIQSQIYTLIKKHSKGLNERIYIIKFSDNYNVYRCELKDDTYIPVDISEIYSNKAHPLKKDTTKGISKLLNTSIGSGTSLGSSLASGLIQSTNKNNSVLLFSDSDIFSGSNADSLKNILSHSKRNSIGVILNTPSDFEGFIKKFGNMYSGFVTHIN